MNRSAILPTIAAAVVLVVSPLPARALQLTFAGSGFVQGPAAVPPLFNDLHIGPSDASYTLGGVAGWAIDVSFDGQLQTSFVDGNLVLGGWTGIMSGRLLRGSDSLSFTGTQASAGLEEPIVMTYSFSGGTGMFSGYAGSGSSHVILMGNPLGLPTPVPFSEIDGLIELQPVPEPGAWALLATGLLAAAGARCRIRTWRSAPGAG